MMNVRGRQLFPYFAAVLGMAAVAYAVSFGTLPPADFTFVNGTEIQSIDPAIVTGAPEGKIINALFEGLLRQDPKTLEPIPGTAERYEVSPDQKTYTFYIRPGCVWSDGTPVTAEDFAWSWRRFLHPETAAEYAYQLTTYVVGADRFNSSTVAPGDGVEVELADRPVPDRLFPQGTILRGKLTELIQPPQSELPATASTKDREKADAAWRETWIYVVDVGGQSRRFRKGSANDAEKIEHCRHVLPDFSTVGIKVLGEQELQVTLKNPTPYFLHLMAFYPMYPVNRACIERHGDAWMKAENLVSNGPFTLQFRRIRDRIRLAKNPNYWNAEHVKLNVIDALAVSSETTALNLYIKGQVDWIESVPSSVLPILKQRGDFHSAPMLTTYFFRLNTTRPPLDNVKVRQALNLALDKREICESLLRAGQQPAQSLVPPGMAGYEQAQSGEYDPTRAQQLLAEAGFPGGKGIPKIQILYNDQDVHRSIAEKVHFDWKKNLGIDVELKPMEWGVYLSSVQQMQYSIARAGWVGDYPDPNTFLDMFMTDGGNNNTGWSNAKYDALLKEASATMDPAERLRKLAEAEAILIDEMPIVPVYFYVSRSLVQPYVHGFATNVQDLHPLHALEIDPQLKAEQRGNRTDP